MVERLNSLVFPEAVLQSRTVGFVHVGDTREFEEPAAVHKTL